MGPSGLEVIGIFACGALIVGAIFGTVALVSSVFDAWGEIKRLREAFADLYKKHNELSAGSTRLSVDVVMDKADQVDLEELTARLDENDAAIERLVEDFDESDQATDECLGEHEIRLDTHNSFIVDIGERLAALEAPAKRKGR